MISRNVHANFNICQFNKKMRTMFGENIIGFTSLNNNVLSILPIKDVTNEEQQTIENLMTSQVPKDGYNIQGRPSIVIVGGNESNTATSSYFTLKNFVFKGCNEHGIPRRVKIIATIDSGVSAGSLRLYDVTNSQTLIETAISTTPPSITTIDVTNEENWSDNECIISIQTKRTSNMASKKIIFYFLEIEFW